MIESPDYHDYVFRDGKLLGEFDAMYRNSATIPWQQDQQENWIDVRLTKEILRDFGRFDEVHDFGCGTGHYLDLMVKNSLATNGKSYGYDISATASMIASRNFPHSSFYVLDLTQRTKNKEQRVTKRTRNSKLPARLFMIRCVLWYVIPELATVIKNIANRMQHSDLLLVVQNFLPLDDSFSGKEVVPDHLTLLKHFSSHFTVSRHIWYEDRKRTVNDNWFIGLFSLKD